MKTLSILVVEDKGHRAERVVQAIQRVKTAGGARDVDIEIRRFYTPMELQKELTIAAAEGELPDGAIVDFSLGLFTRDDVSDDIFLDSLPGYGPFRVTTGIGVLDYLHRTAPGIDLWAMTSSDAHHMRLFQAAAWAMFGAYPIDIADAISEVRESNRRFVDTLRNPDQMTKDAHAVGDSALFIDLLTDRSGITVDDQAISTMSWIAALATTSVGHGIGASRKYWREVYENAASFERVTPTARGSLKDKSLFGAHWRWNGVLQELLKYTVTNVDLAPDWPRVNRDAGYSSATDRESKLLVKYNPYRDYIAKHEQILEFFESEDVHAAVRRWLQEQQR